MRSVSSTLMDRVLSGNQLIIARYAGYKHTMICPLICTNCVAICSQPSTNHKSKFELR